MLKIFCHMIPHCLRTSSAGGHWQMFSLSPMFPLVTAFWPKCDIVCRLLFYKMARGRSSSPRLRAPCPKSAAPTGWIACRHASLVRRAREARLRESQEKLRVMTLFMAKLEEVAAKKGFLMSIIMEAFSHILVVLSPYRFLLNGLK